MENVRINSSHWLRVVITTLRFVAESRKSSRNALERLFCSRIFVFIRVKFDRKFSIGFLYFLRRCTLLNTEDVVQIIFTVYGVSKCLLFLQYYGANSTKPVNMKHPHRQERGDVDELRILP